MGIDISGILLVGLPVEELKDTGVLDLDGDLYEQVINLGLSSASPWFDSDYEYWIIGFRIKNQVMDYKEDWMSVISDARLNFISIFGKDPRLIGAADVM